MMALIVESFLVAAAIALLHEPYHRQDVRLRAACLDVATHRSNAEPVR